MKLAEALAERSDCQNRLEDLKKRMVRTVRVQEGEQPAEDSAELLNEAERLFARVLDSVSAINRTNAKTVFDERRSISDAIAKRDVVVHIHCLLPCARRQNGEGGFGETTLIL